MSPLGDAALPAFDGHERTVIGVIVDGQAAEAGNPSPNLAVAARAGILSLPRDTLPLTLFQRARARLFVRPGIRPRPAGAGAGGSRPDARLYKEPCSGTLEKGQGQSVPG